MTSTHGARTRANSAASHAGRSGTEVQAVSLQQALVQLDRLSTLPPDWDSYGADPPSARAIVIAARIIDGFQEQCRGPVSNSALPLAIVPLSGGVQLEWNASSGSLEIEIDKDGQIGYLLESGVDPDVHYEEGNSITVDHAIDLIVKLIQL